MNVWKTRQLIICVVVFLLLFARFFQGLSVFIYDQLRALGNSDVFVTSIGHLLSSLYKFELLGVLPFVLFVFAISQNQYDKYYADKIFVFLLMFAQVLALAEWVDFVLGCFLILIFFCAGYLIFNRKAKYSIVDVQGVVWGLGILCVFYVVVLLYITRFQEVRFGVTELSLSMFLFSTFPLVVSEEVLYRGLLYSVLGDLGISRLKIVFLQAVLFWIAHINIIFLSPVWFWVILPVFSIVLGYVVFRSRSLSLAVFGHIIYNAISIFLI